MQRKLLLGCISALLLIFAAAPASAQATYAAIGDRPSLSGGGGFSAFDNPDFSSKYTFGYTAVVDWHPPIMPHLLDDVNIEAEFRGLAFHEGISPETHNAIVPTQYTVGGGVMYQPGRLRFHRFSPYAKGVWSWGSISWYSGSNPYHSDTRTVTALGGGLDYRISRRFTARVDYEYQFWPNMFGPNSLTPNGFTIEGLYNFGHRR
jgi:opacity protein-like surface antigen